jgi:hypothetical protein
MAANIILRQQETVLTHIFYQGHALIILFLFYFHCYYFYFIDIQFRIV